ncbi:hypothetical protein QYE76_041581 [Lolium multiflorum]|uniref:Uncharacterized protein n=1 Tax=Lolium multiflorum TaxID=4521 RepID=A0AAD8WWJ0_LOLMU|nr:hypothetical protein QYE76_041581 [Lolium multiflorum]
MGPVGWRAQAQRRRWTNWGLTPPEKLARYANGGEGSSSGVSRRPPRPPVYDSSSEEEDAARMILSAGDYVHDDQEEEAVVAQLAAVSDAEARARWCREEADAVRRVREYEEARREERVRRVKLEIIELDAE